MGSPYDEIAGMYHAQWADWYLPAVRGALDELFFKRLSPGAQVLDLCCGSGHVTRELVDRGLMVTGVDASAGLIEIARNELPGADFRVQDARHLALGERRYHAALSTFDSLNHILDLDALREVFRGVHTALKPGGFFLFDMNLEEAYRMDLHQWNVTITDQSVGLVRGLYDRTTKIGSTELVWFNKHAEGECWTQHKSVVEERCYTENEILAALSAAGFAPVRSIPANATPMPAEFAFGRTFFVAECAC